MSEKLFTAHSEVVACELDGGKALLDLRGSRYYKLNRSAALIWEWIGEGSTLSLLVDRMLQRFDVDRSQCEEDVIAIISSFEKAGLVDARTIETLPDLDPQ